MVNQALEDIDLNQLVDMEQELDDCIEETSFGAKNDSMSNCPQPTRGKGLQLTLAVQLREYDNDHENW